MNTVTRRSALALYGGLFLLALAACADDPVAAVALHSEPMTAAAAGTTAAPQPSEEMQELVAPIALYPDVLVGQILAAATQPADVVHVALWLQEQRDASVFDRAQAVDGKAWDAGIKALTLFPELLDAMNRNYVWTVALGEVYAADPEAVLRAVQAVRRKAQAAGMLASTSDQRVINDHGTILIEPANPDFVYLPGGGLYDCSAGDRFTWGWLGWNVDWQHGALRYQDARYVSARE